MTPPAALGADVPFVDAEARRVLVRAAPAVDGIDFIEVVSNRAGTPGHVPGSPSQRTLLVHLLHGPVPGDLDASRVRVLGGVRFDPRINPVRVEWAHPAAAIDAGPPDGVTAADRALVLARVSPADLARVLVVRTSSSGDWSTYVLALYGAGAQSFPAGFDEPLSTQSFTFTVDCPDHMDCRPDGARHIAPPVSPQLDYLARDYAALRTRLIDRVSVLVPGWSDRNPADPVVTLLELFAHVGDRLAYMQDAIAAEAYLPTARQRRSVRRHARLLDYRVHDGCAARVWLTFTTAAPLSLPPRTPVAGLERPLPPGAGVTEALDEGATVFETVDPAHLLPARNVMRLHAWGDPDAVLPIGATACHVRHPVGAHPNLSDGDVVVLAPLDADGVTVVGEEARRIAVRLDGDPVVCADPFVPETVLALRWVANDALTVPLPVARRAADGTAEPAAVALANVVLAEHAASLPPRALQPPQAPNGSPYRPRVPLGTTRLAWTHRTVDRRSAAAVLRPDARAALPDLELDDGARTWTPVPDLLASGRLDEHFVAELDDDGTVRLRFGDGTAGRRPSEGTAPRAWLRVGGGTDGNIGADVLGEVLPTSTFVPPADLIVTNPLPARGGVDPEPVDQVKELAPHAFRTQLRAVTSADYAVAAREHPGVQRAVANRRWTGSWYAQEVALDPIAARGDDPSITTEVTALLELRRMAGVDVELERPVYVPLEIVIGVCVADGYSAADVERQLRRRFAAGSLPDGGLGFFHPDRFTFGQPLLLSDLVATAMAAPGVAWVDVGDDDTGVLRFRRLGRGYTGEAEIGRIDAGPREVLRADSDPSNPENGRIGFVMRGGS